MGMLLCALRALKVEWLTNFYAAYGFCRSGLGALKIV